MRCEEVRESLVAYLDGELSPSECERIDAHLADCRDCNLERADLGSTGRLLNLIAGGPSSDIDIADTVLGEVKEGDPWCRHIQRNLVAQRDGELTEKEARPVLAHLEECESCAGEARGLDRTDAALALWTLPEFDVDLVSRVFERAGIRRKTRRPAILKWAAAAACVLIAAGIFTLLSGDTPLSGDSDSPPQDVLQYMDILDPDTLTILEESPELLEMAEDLDWLEGIPDEELAMLNGQGG